MPRFVLIYYGEPKFERPEDGKNYQSKWRTWAGGLGDFLVDPAIPLVKPNKTVSTQGVSDSSSQERLSGFSIVEADDMASAIEMAKSNPHLEHGTMEVAQTTDMGM